VLDDLEFLVAGGMKEKMAKREILDFLFARVTRLAETPDALRRQPQAAFHPQLLQLVSARLNQWAFHLGFPPVSNRARPSNRPPVLAGFPANCSPI